MKYGYFDDERREYVLTTPKTPVKWINYIGTLSFGGFVDHTGGALICKGDPALNRITKYIPQLPSSDFKGETLYVRLRREPGAQGKTRKSGAVVFSPFYTPTLKTLRKWECRVGLGYTRWLCEYRGLRVEVLVTVEKVGQPAIPVELRQVKVTNLSSEAVEVDLAPVVEYTHPDALKQFTNADWVPQTMQSTAQRLPACQVILRQYPFMFRDIKHNFFTANIPCTSFETDRKRFLGDNEYGSWARPLALEHIELSNTQALRGDNIAAMLLPLGSIPPGDTRSAVTLLGQVEASVDLPGALAQFYAAAPAVVEEAMQNQARFWEAHLLALQVRTPDKAFDSMVNVHNPRQCFITYNWSRYLSLYQLGLGGSRGIGCRDSSQDVMGVLSSQPELAWELLKKLLSIQKQNGSAMHQFNPLTMEGSAGDSLEREDRPHYYSDDHLWIVLAVCELLKETGWMRLLDEVIPFYEKDKAGKPLETASVWAHLERALAFTRGDVGAHGLPLLGFADWNDTVNLPTGAESVFTAALYGRALLEMVALSAASGRQADAEAFRADYAVMQEQVNAAAWDGAWYKRYFDADGTPLGSHVNTYGQIYLNAQSWAVISGFAASERAHMAMDSVKQRLNTAKGIKLSAPGFNGFDPSRGGVTTYPPGAKENGGIFLHTNPWAVIAETMLGRGDQAYAYYSQINPAAKNDILDEYECEPYVYPQNILADEHPQFGLARNSWLSGTASWMYQAATKYILGIRPSYQGLVVDPCLPAEWDGYEARRFFRGDIYTIRVHNPHHLPRSQARLVRRDAGKVIEVTLEPA